MGLANTASGFALAAAALWGAADGVARAQGATQAAAPDQSQEQAIVVTGSRIPRPDFSATSPIVTITRETIEQHGVLELEDYLNTQPQVSPDFSRTANNPGDGAAHANLRSLGSARTLVLLNGRRLAPPDTGTAVDLNAIPEAVLARVDVVTGGASAVYGSDAVAGVVNFVTRRDLHGVSFGWQGDLYGAGDGRVDDEHVVWGAQALQGRAHLLAYVDDLHRDPVLQGDRPFSRSVIADDKTTGELFNGGSLAGPQGTIDVDGDPADALIFDPPGSLRPFQDPNDLFNFAYDNYLQMPMQRLSAGAFASLDLSPHTEAFFELMYANPRVDAELAPTPLSAFINVPIDAPFFDAQTRQTLSDNFDPDADGVAHFRIRRRLSEAEPRLDKRDRTYWRGVAGLDGRLADWDWQAAFSYDRNDTDEQLENVASRSRLLQGVMVDAAGNCLDPSNGCVAVNIFGAGQISDAAIDFIRINSVSIFTRTEQQVANASITGAPFDLPAGPLHIALGAEWRRVRSDYEPDSAFFTGDVLGIPSLQPVHGAFEVREAFGEALVPILVNAPWARELSFEAGARFTDHSTAGDSWTWKYGLQWRPIADLRLRAMEQRAVRAPNIAELDTQPSLSLGSVSPGIDFCAASNDPVGAGLASVCVAQGMSASAIGVYDPHHNYFVDIQSGGNPALAPEIADTFTAGVDWQTRGPIVARASLDYVRIRLRDAIENFGAGFDLEECALSADPNSAACRVISRNPDGSVDTINSVPINFARALIEAIDVDFSLQAPAPRWARIAPDAEIGLDVRASHYLQNASAPSPGEALFDCTGFFACGDYNLQGAVTPATTAVTSLTYRMGPFEALLRWRWIEGVDNVAAKAAEFYGDPTPVLAIPHLGAVNYVDLAFKYDVGDHVQLRAGVDNILEQSPPLMASDQVQSNTDPARYDVFGRRFFVALDFRFGN